MNIVRCAYDASGDSLAENIGLELVVFNATTVVFVNNLEEGVNVLSLD
jgi:hypothetical protein